MRPIQLGGTEPVKGLGKGRRGGSDGRETGTSVDPVQITASLAKLVEQLLPKLRDGDDRRASIPCANRLHKAWRSSAATTGSGVASATLRKHPVLPRAPSYGRGRRSVDRLSREARPGSWDSSMRASSPPPPARPRVTSRDAFSRQTSCSPR